MLEIEIECLFTQKAYINKIKIEKVRACLGSFSSGNLHFQQQHILGQMGLGAP